MKRKAILLVMDGWGIAPPGPGNYIEQANKPVFDDLWARYPHSINQASGNAVGLPEGAQGNSEVGHLHMGAGRVVWQMYEKINRAVRDGSLKKNQALLKVMKSVREQGALHLIGLCSDEGVHAHLDHLLAVLEMAREQGCPRVYVHFIADGRDVPEKSAQRYVDQIEKAGGVIATVVGRYYSLDRDHNWDRTQAAYDLLTQGIGHRAKSATEAVKSAYTRGDKTDYYIEPTVIVGEDDRPVALLREDDAVIFFNFRTDRPRQLVHALVDETFESFDRAVRPRVKLVPFTAYDESLSDVAAFTEDRVTENLGGTLAAAGLKQLRLAETEKYAHVTYFFNSQIEEPYPGEERILIPSLKVPSYDLAPEMSASGIADEAVQQILSEKFDFILINLANCDLVGHSAVKEAIIKCVEAVDDAVGRIVAAGLAHGYTILVTADHGSAEDKLYDDGSPKPSHSLNPVPFIVVSNDPGLQQAQVNNGGQADVAPTILRVMELEQPAGMTGQSLLA